MLAGFLVSIALLAAAYGVYKATGPHPEIRLVIRKVKHFAHWLLPDLKRTR